MINKQNSFEIYKILIANDANHINGKQYGRDLAKLAIDLADAFEETYINVKSSQIRELQEIQSNLKVV